MNVTITPTKLHGPVTPPPSKSQAHRLIIAAALAQGESVLTHVAPSQDILATIRCMEALGASFTWSGSTLTVQGLTMNRPTPSLPRLACGESGSPRRCLIPHARAVGGGGGANQLKRGHRQFVKLSRRRGPCRRSGGAAAEAVSFRSVCAYSRPAPFIADRAWSV